METMVWRRAIFTNSTIHTRLKLSTSNLIAIIGVNIGLAFMTWFVLRVVFKPKPPEEKEEKKPNDQTIEDEHSSLIADDINNEKPTTGTRIIHEGEAAGDYSEKWTSTFDLVYIIMMIIMLIILCVITTLDAPAMWTDLIFWSKQMIIFFATMTAMFCGGLICRHFCQTDEKGYIITNRYSPFKVNYTKKFHHFAVYMVPLLLTGIKSNSTKSHETIELLWGYYFTFVATLLLIKPLRERSKFLMIQFNAIDRPEDRPNTLMWLIVCNNIPAHAVTIFFRWLYPLTGLHRNLTNIFLFTNTVGDGFAEPVGIYFGKHRYKTRGCFNKTKYERSFEGSSCVFLTTVIFTSIYWREFKTFVQFWITIAILPFLMAVTEATSPHTCDSSLIHLVGGITMFITSHLYIKWG